MPFRKLLIANRGEIAIRIARAAAAEGLRSVAVHSSDDALSLHVRAADEARDLPGRGAAAYLDVEAIVDAAKQAGCDALHPGYGFLSESAVLARRCAEEGIIFIGPSPDNLDLFGDKPAAKTLAARCGVPVIEATPGPATLEDAHAFFASLGEGAAVMIKAIAGGGGRGMRVVEDAGRIGEAYARCQSEARAAFGRDGVYVERLIRRARHVEVQVIGDRHGAISHLWDRECTVQRRHQKLIEVAPSPSLDDATRARIVEAAVRIATEARYDSLGTVEFLIDGVNGDFAFIEANPRLQVEHTVTEEVLGIDLVRAQIAVAGGAPLSALNLDQPHVPVPRGHAMQLRINMEEMGEDGQTRPTGGRIATFDPPSGPGVRVDGFGYSGYATSTAFDSLLAKLIVHAPAGGWADVVRKAERALREFRIDGVTTNIPFLQAILTHADFRANRIDTGFIDTRAAALVAAIGDGPPPLHFPAAPADQGGTERAAVALPEGLEAIAAPLHGLVVAIDVAEGQTVLPGQQLAVMEAMKMEHPLLAVGGGRIVRILAAAGATLAAGDALFHVEPVETDGEAAPSAAPPDPDAIRPDLAEVLERHAMKLDAARPAAVARRRKTGQRTARENIAQLVDDGSFQEYGSFAIAAQRRRRSVEDLIATTPADGLIAGVATVNAAQVGTDKARCMVLSYDYSVLAGTQGSINHKKIDRMLGLAEKWRIPLVFYAEGGGGRPGDTDGYSMTGLDVPSFRAFARLSGLAPVVGVVSGYCFAGNAALLGCCDVIIATRGASIGMGGPVMIEGGGLGVHHPADVGPTSVQAPNGVIDLLVEDEEEATLAARQYLSYFQGPVADWTAPDQRLLRHAIPENRLRVYDIRAVVDLLADAGSVMELRRDYGPGMITALIRIEGRPFGLIANNPQHIGGAIDATACDKAARFLQLCDAHDLPIVSLCDTPGFMVGPDTEKTAMVRRAARMFVVGASISVPLFGVVLRKGYGLGAQAMLGGSFHAADFTIAWPTGEFGGMGLEGYVRLGFRKEMDAIADAAERDRFFQQKLAQLYANGKAASIASVLEIDEVIDPADTRARIIAGLRSVAPPPPRDGRKRPCIDSW